MLVEDPCAGVDLPRMKRREMEALSVDECRRFLAVARESEWFGLFALALTTGMRPSEYLALKWRGERVPNDPNLWIRLEIRRHEAQA